MIYTISTYRVYLKTRKKRISVKSQCLQKLPKEFSLENCQIPKVNFFRQIALFVLIFLINQEKNCQIPKNGYFRQIPMFQKLTKEFSREKLSNSNSSVFLYFSN